MKKQSNPEPPPLCRVNGVVRDLGGGRHGICPHMINSTNDCGFKGRCDYKVKAHE